LNNPLIFTDPSGYVTEENERAYINGYWYQQDSNGAGSTGCQIGVGTRNLGPSSGIYSDVRYNYSTGFYTNRSGRIVRWSEIYNNYIVPNFGKLEFLGARVTDRMLMIDFNGYTPPKKLVSDKRLIGNDDKGIYYHFTKSKGGYTVPYSSITVSFGDTYGDERSQYAIYGISSATIGGDPVNMLTTKSPIEDIFRRIQYLNDRGKLQSLNDIIIPNGYGKNTPMGPHYHKRISISGYTYDLRISPYSSSGNQRYFYDVFDLGFGHLDRFSEYPKTKDYNSGYSYGFYLTGYERNVLIQIGANNVSAYDYLRLIFHNQNR
jgi:hypothetical protein